MYQQYRNKRNLKPINTKNIGLQNTKKIETSK